VKKSDYSAGAWNRNAGRITDFALEIDASPGSGPKECLYGVVFRFQDTDNFYRFLVSGDGYYIVGTKLNGVWTTLQSKTKSAFINQGNSTNHLKVVCQGTRIEVYVKSQLLYQLS